MLCECGASKGARADKRGCSALHVASEAGHAGTVRVLCERGALPAVAQANVDGALPAHLAAEQGHVACLRVLAELGADMSARNGRGLTPAMVAAGAGQVAALHALHAMAGVDVGGASAGGLTAAHSAAEGGHVEVLSALEEMGKRELLSLPDLHAGLTPAHVAAGGRQPQSIRRLHQLGASLVGTAGSPPACLRARATPWRGACMCGVMAHARSLWLTLARPGRDGRTPAHVAALNSDTEVLVGGQPPLCTHTALRPLPATRDRSAWTCCVMKAHPGPPRPILPCLRRLGRINSVHPSASVTLIGPLVSQVLSALLDCGAGASMLVPDQSGRSATQYACGHGLGSWLAKLCRDKWGETSWASRCVLFYCGAQNGVSDGRKGRAYPKPVEQALCCVWK